MWKWIFYTALAALVVWLLWPVLFPEDDQNASVIGPVPSEYGNAYGFIDASGTQVTAVGTNAVQYTLPTGSGILDNPVAPPALPILAGGTKNG